MARQYSTTLRNAWLSTYESTIGTAPKLRILTGSPPASASAAQTGTLLLEMSLPSDWMGAPSSGSINKLGTWEGTVTTDGTAGYYRIVNTAGSPTECHEQGTVTRSFSITTSSSTAANSNVLNFSSTSGVSAGQTVSGTGIPSGATVLAATATTVTISTASTSGVSSGVAIYFGDTTGDLYLSSTALTVGQVITITARTLTAPGA